MVAPFQAPTEPNVESGNTPKTESNQLQPKNNDRFLTVQVAAVLFLSCLLFVAVGVSAHFSNIYDNWWGPFPLADSVELFSDLHHLTPVDTKTTCWPEGQGASLHLLRRVEDYVLIEYHAPTVSVNDSSYPRCLDGTQVIMSLYEWNRMVRSYRWQLEERTATLAAEQRRREIEQRLFAQ